MCGIEILLCCAAGGAAGCCAKHKLDKAGRKKGVKGESEIYKKNASKENKNPKKGSDKDKKKKGAEQVRHRLPAYEEYQLRYATKPESEAPAARLNRRSVAPESPKGGEMDSEEFHRLKEAQRKQKLDLLKY